MNTRSELKKSSPLWVFPAAADEKRNKISNNNTREKVNHHNSIGRAWAFYTGKSGKS